MPNNNSNHRGESDQGALTQDSNNSCDYLETVHLIDPIHLRLPTDAMPETLAIKYENRKEICQRELICPYEKKIQENVGGDDLSVEESPQPGANSGPLIGLCTASTAIGEGWIRLNICQGSLYRRECGDTVGAAGLFVGAMGAMGVGQHGHVRIGLRQDHVDVGHVQWSSRLV